MNSFRNITSATTTAVKSGSGKVNAIIINTPVANGVITVYDNTAASGTKIGTITLPATVLADVGKVVKYECSFNTGLTVVTSAATDITVVYE